MAVKRIRVTSTCDKCAEQAAAAGKVDYVLFSFKCFSHSRRIAELEDMR